MYKYDWTLSVQLVMEKLLVVFVGTQEERVYKTSMVYVQKIVRGINEQIKPLSMAIKSASCELSGKKYFIFMLTVEKSVVK
jgi:hypothetical protein